MILLGFDTSFSYLNNLNKVVWYLTFKNYSDLEYNGNIFWLWEHLLQQVNECLLLIERYHVADISYSLCVIFVCYFLFINLLYRDTVFYCQNMFNLEVVQNEVNINNLRTNGELTVFISIIFQFSHG